MVKPTVVLRHLCPLVLRQGVEQVGRFQLGPACLKLFKAQAAFIQYPLPHSYRQGFECLLKQEGVEQGDVEEPPAAGAAAAPTGEGAAAGIEAAVEPGVDFPKQGPVIFF